MQPVSTVGFSDDKSFIFCRAFSHAFHNPGDLFLWLSDCSTGKSDKVLLRQYRQTPIDPMGMAAYSKGNKQTKKNKQLGGELH